MRKTLPSQAEERQRRPPVVHTRVRRQIAVLRVNYGPEIEARDLRRIMGFRTITAFHRALASGKLGLDARRVAGRRGVFARVEDVAEWLVRTGRRIGVATQPTS